MKKGVVPILMSILTPSAFALPHLHRKDNTKAHARTLYTYY